MPRVPPAGWQRGPSIATLPQGFVDPRHGDVTVVRPMREYTAKEVAFYNHFFDVPTVIAPPLPTKVGTSPHPWWRIPCSASPHPTPCALLSLPQRREKPSIHRLIERFLLGLQEDFPATISTVYRYAAGGAPWGEGGGGLGGERGAHPPTTLAAGRARS